LSSEASRGAGKDVDQNVKGMPSFSLNISRTFHYFRDSKEQYKPIVWLAL